MRKFYQQLKELSFQKELPSQRIEIEIPSYDLFYWLNGQNIFPRLYWRERESSFKIAGLGEIDSLVLDRNDHFIDWVSMIKNRLGNVFEHQRYYGLVAFSERYSSTDLWNEWPYLYFILPAIEMFQIHNQTFVACNIRANDIVHFNKQKALILSLWEKIEWRNSQLATLFQEKEGEGEKIEVRERFDCPSYDLWQKMVEDVLDDIGSQKIHKLVMSRHTFFTLKTCINPINFLKKCEKDSVETYHFLLQKDRNNAFLSLTPERLYQRKKRKILIDSIAGTVSRGESLSEDLLFENQLKNSVKEKKEHQYVLDHFLEKLPYWVDKVTVYKKLSVVKLSKVQHLFSQISGLVKKDVLDINILKALHPSAAILGCPQEKACSVLFEKENFSRGLFTGLIGAISSSGRDEVEFAVSIRCALIKHLEIHLFAGAGIVEGSVPLSEWKEIEHKMDHFLKVILR